MKRCGACLRFTALAAFVLGVFAAVGGAACGQGKPQQLAASAGPTDAVYHSPYVAELTILEKIWRGPPVKGIEDFFTVTGTLEGRSITAPTHLFGPVNVIPYSSQDNISDAAGAAVERGDAEIAKAFPPGAVGFAIKHHRPEHRELSADNASQDKENFKLQDSHISAVVGVMRDGQRGAVTLNNPQDYEQGRFGSPAYSMIFVRPTYPKYLSAAQKIAFNDNIRTMLAGFNAVSHFPGDYNGGDPLSANNVEKVRVHAAMMVRAITGDADARRFFQDPANQIYCAELAFLSASAGIIAPLNAMTFIPLVGRETWDKFVREVKTHNAGGASAFTALNRNGLVKLVRLSLAPDELQAAAQYAPQPIRAAESQRLAWQPMTMSDIVDQSLRSHVPREQLGEKLAPFQGAILARMKPGLLESLGMERLPETDARRRAAEALFDEIVAVVSQTHRSYAEFRRKLEPLLARARKITGPRGGDGAGLFAPPLLFHVVGQGKHPGGLLGLEYVGHGIHFSAVRIGRP
jgi:hypothetical protein